MQKTVLSPQSGPAPRGAYSPGLRFGDFIFVSGQGPLGEDGNIIDGDIESQTRATFANLKRVLEAGEASLADIVSVKVYLADLDDFNRYDAVYRELMPEPFPVRTTIGCSLRNMRIEIDAIAIAPR